ncbi:MAG: DUF3299 domain-containing protein [Pseudomonadota bacterium]
MYGVKRLSRLISLTIMVLLVAMITRPFAVEIPTELSWADLIPESAREMQPISPTGTVLHGQLTTPVPDISAAKVTREYNGQTIRIPGFIVPLEFTGSKVTEFLLVPYIGACIHVPPPPANQLIFVTSENPHELKGLFEPVYVTGMFGAAASTTELAEVGYEITAANIEPYE